MAKSSVYFSKYPLIRFVVKSLRMELLQTLTLPFLITNLCYIVAVRMALNLLYQFLYVPI